MEKRGNRKFDSVYSNKVKAGRRRTYFIDVQKTKGEDYFITMTESTKRFRGRGYDRQKVVLYKEDFNRFLAGLEDAIEHIKTELMPDYDYTQFDRKSEEWERKHQEENKTSEATDTEVSENDVSADANGESEDSEEDISW